MMANLAKRTQFKIRSAVLRFERERKAAEREAPQARRRLHRCPRLPVAALLVRGINVGVEMSSLATSTVAPGPGGVYAGGPRSAAFRFRPRPTHALDTSSAQDRVSLDYAR
jgi:hypothetical protein